MAPFAKIDSVRTLSMKEKNGVIVELRRLAIVSGLGEDVDHGLLMTALEQTGIPLPNSVPESANNNQAFQTLFLTQRNPTITGGDKSTVEVELVYETATGSDGQDMKLGDVEGVVYGRMAASMKQAKTNFYYPNGDTTKEKVQIVVGHRYTSADKDRKNRYFSQGGEIDVQVPQSNYHIGGIIDTNAPEVIAAKFIAAVNKVVWLFKPPREWMCTMVAWKRMGRCESTEKFRYAFEFEFQHDEETWDPTVVFVDDRTGRPPPGLLEEGDPNILIGEEAGIKQIPYHRPVDFEEELGVIFEQQ